MSEQWVAVCKETDLIMDSGVCAQLGDEQVAIFKEASKGDVFAISNYDPFGEANVLSRGIIGSFDGKMMVASPLYKQHFDLVSGQCLEEEDVSVKAYSVKVEDGNIYLS